MFDLKFIRVGQKVCKYQTLRFIHSEPKKRFYKNVSIVQSNGTFEINLDHRKLKTPMGSAFQISSEPLAQAVANEWLAQKDVINLSQMHINGLCNTSIDNPGNADKQKLTNSILSFLETDTVLYYGEEPPELLKTQMEKWSPIILWFRERFGVQVEPTTDFKAPVSESDLKIMERHLMSYNWNALNGLAFGVDALKSIILALACIERRVTVSEAVSLARLELLVQTGHWGSVEWAHDIEEHDTTARLAAATMFVHFNSAQSNLKSKNVQM